MDRPVSPHWTGGSGKPARRDLAPKLRVLIEWYEPSADGDGYCDPVQIGELMAQPMAVGNFLVDEGERIVREAAGGHTHPSLWRRLLAVFRP